MNQHSQRAVVTLSKDHWVQLRELSEATDLPWQQVLDEALSEYRGLVGVSPPASVMSALDATVTLVQPPQVAAFGMQRA